MKQERPAPVLVVAVLGVLVGGLAMAVGGGAACLAAGGWPEPIVALPVKGKAEDSVLFLRTSVAAYGAYEVARPAALALLGAALIGAGAALLRSGRRARRAALVLAGLCVAFNVGTFLYEIGYVLPALEDWRSSAQRGYNGNVSQISYLWLMPVALLTVALVVTLHGVITLLVLQSPAVADAFAEPADRPVQNL